MTTHILYPNLGFCQPLNLFDPKKRADIESIYDHLIKTNASALEKSSIDEVISKLTDYNLVANKETSARIDSF